MALTSEPEKRGGYALNRKGRLKAILFIPVFFTISFGALSVLVLAQGSGVGGAEIRSKATLTTMDTLDAADFVRPVVSPGSPKVGRAKKSAGSKNLSQRVPGTGSSSIIEKSAEPELIATISEIGKVVEDRRQIEVEPVTQAVSTGSPKIDDLVTNAAAKYSLDAHLIFAVMRQESSFNPRATSSKGARGLMQLMPATAMRLGVRDIYDPAQNIDGGARYLRFLMDTFNGDVQLTLAAYNAGEGAVARYGNRIPPYRETIDYVQRISAHYTRLKNGNEDQRRTTSKRLRIEQVQPELLRGIRTLAQY